MIRVLSIKQEHLTDEPVMKILSSSFLDSSVPSKKPTDNSSSNLSKFGLRDHSSFERFPGSWAPCVKPLSHSRQSHRWLLLKAQEKKSTLPPHLRRCFMGRLPACLKMCTKISILQASEEDFSTVKSSIFLVPSLTF